MPKITIDGKEIEVADGTTVIQAAEEAGTYIPRYCYHPGLSIAGNCRICLVEVENMPKLQIACNQPVMEGMVVNTKSERVRSGREEVLEFLLSNHPLDCPVCDQSGECDLQNFYMNFGQYDSKFEEQKFKKEKKKPLGEKIMLDQERCILCSRCERFTDEVSKTGEFGIFNRGHRAEIDVHPDSCLDDNDYAGNVADICPVGALTDRDFRFKARVWYLSTAPSVCNGCSKGCSIDVNYVLDRPHLADGARVMRLKPRYNEAINKWWMCDEGRYGYKFVDKNRTTQVLHHGNEVTWDSAFIEVSRELTHLQEAKTPNALGVLVSPQLTTEELFVTKRLFVDQLQAQVAFLKPKVDGKADDLLMQADKNPNTKAAELLGLTQTQTPDAIFEKVIAGEIKVLWVQGQDLAALYGEDKLETLKSKLDLLIYQGSNENATSEKACWVLPTAVYLEKDGTFINVDSRIQVFRKAFDPLPGVRTDLDVLLKFAKEQGVEVEGTTPVEVLSNMGTKEAVFRGLTYAKLGDQGAVLGAEEPVGA